MELAFHTSLFRSVAVNSEVMGAMSKVYHFSVCGRTFANRTRRKAKPCVPDLNIVAASQ